MEDFSVLIEQLKHADYKRVTFGIFNFIDSEGFVDEVSSCDKTKYDIEDFCYYKFNLSDKEKNGIKYSKKEIIHFFKEFKSYIENSVQKNNIPKIRIYIIKESGSLIAVKLVEFNVDL